jgi:hypothetical protein
LVVATVIACGGSSVEERNNEGAGGGGAEQGAGGSDSEASEGGSSAQSAGGSDAEQSEGGGGAKLGTGASAGEDDGSAEGGAKASLTEGGSAGTVGGFAPVPPGAGAFSSVTLAAGGSGGMVFESVGGSLGTGGSAVGGGSVGEPPEGCSPQFISSGPEHCEAGYECPTGFAWVFCDMWEPGEIRCDCESDTGFQQYELSALPDQEPCTLIAGLCLGDAGAAVEFTDPPQCVGTSQGAGDNWCEIGQECIQSAEIADGISVQSSQYQSTWCDLYDDTWRCSCDSEAGRLSLEFSASVAAADVCPNALELCSSGPVEIEGPRECSLRFQSGVGEYCDAQHDCAGTATIDGTEVQVLEPMYIACYSEVEGEWTCECGLGTKSTDFELSSPDAWTTCEDAAVTCAGTLFAE